MADGVELQQAIALSLQADASAPSTEMTALRGTGEPQHKRHRSSGESEAAEEANLVPITPHEQPGRINASDRLADNTPREIVLAPLGESRWVHLAACVRNHRQMSPLTVEHGSSLSLISKATTLLNVEFNDMDPEADWAKWEALGATIYFFAVTDEENPAGPPAGVLRLVLDGDFSNKSGSGVPNIHDVGALGATCSRRVIVDYLMTSAAARGRGYAGRLLDCARELARSSTANLLVLAIEESCPFWMTHGFVLDDGPINKRINCFPDTHLLKLPTNRLDAFPAPFESVDEEEDDGQADDDEDEDEDEEEEEERQLQQALIASMLQTAAIGPGPKDKGGTSQPAAATAVTAATAEEGGGADDSAPIDLTVRLDEHLVVQSGHAHDNDEQENSEDDEDEDDQLQQALLASMLPTAAAGPELKNVGGATHSAAREAAAAADGLSPIDLTDHLDSDLSMNTGQANGDEKKDEEMQLQLAISLSLNCGGE